FYINILTLNNIVIYIKSQTTDFQLSIFLIHILPVDMLVIRLYALDSIL
ncbi:MAG: hypothetical protein RL387_1930, partial [Bacteroidota bacterium]